MIFNPYSKKTFIISPNKVSSSALLYMPINGDIEIITDDKNISLSDAYAIYYFESFGKPNITYLPFPKEHKKESSSQDINVITPKFISNVVDISKNIGFNIEDVFSTINDKFLFQQLVIKTLGREFSTNPKIVKKGLSLEEFINTVEDSLKFVDNIVLKISDTEGASGGGKWVEFVQDITQAKNFLISKVAIDNNILTYDILIENFIPHKSSPSNNVYITPDNIFPLTFNNQLLDGASCIGVTNVISRDISTIREEVIKLSIALAQECQRIGARGFLGFDYIITDDNKLVVIEANYRNTASSVAEFTTLKAGGFSQESNWCNWLYIQKINYNNSVLNFMSLYRLLKDNHFLYEGIKSIELNDINVIPFKAHNSINYNLIIFWRKDYKKLDFYLDKVSQLLSLLNANIVMKEDSGNISIYK